MGRLHLLPELQRQCRPLKRSVPATSEPIDSSKTAEQDAAELLAAPRRRLAFQLLQDGACAIQLCGTDQPSGEGHAGALVVLQPDTQAVFELEATLEQARGDVGRSRFDVRDLRDRHGQERWIADALGCAKRRPRVAERGIDVGLKHVSPASVREDPGAPCIVIGGRGERLVAKRDHFREIVLARRGQLQQHIGALEPGWQFGEQPLQQRDGALEISDETMQIRRAQPPSSRQARVIAGSKRRSQLRQVRAGGGRPSGSRVIGSRIQFRRGDGVRPLSSERQMTGPLLHLNHSPGQQSVRRATFLRWSLLITNRRQ